jgi:hypothetical protein
MISKKNAQIEHGITDKDLNAFGTLGLEVPSNIDDTQTMIVYYLHDIEGIKATKNAKTEEERQRI